MILLSYCLIVLLSYSPIEEDSLARHYLELGEIKKAEKIYSRVSNKDSKLPNVFLLGEIAYFNYKFEQALNLYGKVPANSNDSNDALSRTIIIKGNDEKELQDYVTAKLLGRKKKFEQGIEILRKLCKERKQNNLNSSDSLFLSMQKDSSDGTTVKLATTITPWAKILLIDFLKELTKYEEALKECQNFIKRFPENNKLLQVKLEMARICANLGQTKKAQEIYEKILLKHPMSTITPIAREELENL